MHLLNCFAVLTLFICIQAIEANKAVWVTLFEPFAFFEAYKDYLQIDIKAQSGDDFRNWKGWVESRLRQLTLMVISVGSKNVICERGFSNF